MRIFQILLTAIWVVVLVITAIAMHKEGIAASVDVFSNDLAAGNWRSQFDADLLAHMLLVGLWAAWRRGFNAIGILTGLCCALGGSLFTMIFVVLLSISNKGDMRKILLGVNAERYS